MHHRETADGLEAWSRALVGDRAARLVFSSCDIDETCARVANIFKPHQLGVARPRQRLDAQMFHAPLATVSLNYLCYGAEVEIDPDCLETFFLVQMPIRGGARIRCGREDIQSGRSIASVLTPTERLRMRWSHDCEQLIVRLDRRLVEQTLHGLLGFAPERPVTFRAGLDMRGTPSWLSAISFLVNEMQTGRRLAGDRLTGPVVDQMVATALLATQEHNYDHALAARAAPAAPKHVKKIENYIEAHAHEPITPADLARHANVSLRSVYAGFRDFRGVTPMAYLQRVRLRRVRQELQSGRAASVTEAAMRWGFSHLGRFSAAYKREFGESPGQTRRRG